MTLYAFSNASQMTASPEFQWIPYNHIHQHDPMNKEVQFLSINCLLHMNLVRAQTQTAT